MENKRDSQNIYFKDLLFTALRRWRALLAVALIGAVLLGGMQFVSGLRGSNKTAQSKYDQERKQYEVAYESLSTKIDVLQENLRTQRDYMEKSVFMRLNPYAFYDCNVKIYVDTHYQVNPELSLQNPDKTGSVLAAYEAAFLGGQFVDTLAALASTEPKYATELVSCTTSAAAGTLSVSISCVNKDIANACLNAIATQLEALHKEIGASVIEHDITVLNKSVSQKVDQNIVVKQAEITDRTTNFQKVLDEAELQRSSLVAPRDTGSPLYFIVYVGLFALLGAFLGVFLVVCVLWVMHISSDKVYSAQTLRDHTGIKVLGCIRSKAVKSKIDLWLLRKDGRNVNDTETQLQLLSASIRNRCGDAASILVTGYPTTEVREKLIPALQAVMADKKIYNTPSLCVDVDAQNTLANCDAVVLIAQCDVSMYKDVLAEAEVVNECGKTLLGCVLLDG